MIIYTQTPDYYQEYLEHGWLKDQAAKVHKYLERWRGKNGKWYYRYASAAKNAVNKVKSKALDLKTKYNRSKVYKNMAPIFYEAREDYLANKKPGAATITKNYGKTNTWKFDTGRATSRSGNVGYTKNGISAGRKRVADKKQAQEKEMARIREAFSAPEVRARALKNRKNYILKENYWNPKNNKRQAQLDSYKKKRKK